MDPKSILDIISKEENLAGYVLLWFDKSGEHFMTGGNVALCIGMLRYASKALEDHLVKSKPLTLIPTDPTVTQPPGTA